MKILMYHDIVSETPEDIHSVTLSNFALQLKWLFQHGYRTYTLDDYAQLLNKGEDLSKAVILTFDDGYEDNFINAFPLLMEYGFTANIFLVSGLVGQYSTWRKNGLADTKLMNWHQVYEMQKSGIQFGSHTMSHANLAILNDELLQYELVVSRQTLQEKLGVPVKTISYPYSQVTPRVREFVIRAGYDVGCTYQPGYIGDSGVDLLMLKRIGILATDTISTFQRKVRGDFLMKMGWRFHRHLSQVSLVRFIKQWHRSMKG